MIIRSIITLFVFVVLTTLGYVVHGQVCTPRYCATIKCEGIKSSTCTANGQVLVPFGGICGCCPVCGEKIKKGERCGGFQLLRDASQKAACERGTMCKKRVEQGYFVCD